MNSIAVLAFVKGLSIGAGCFSLYFALKNIVSSNSLMRQIGLGLSVGTVACIASCLVQTLAVSIGLTAFDFLILLCYAFLNHYIDQSAHFCADYVEARLMLKFADENLVHIKDNEAKFIKDSLRRLDDDEKDMVRDSTNAFLNDNNDDKNSELIKRFNFDKFKRHVEKWGE